MKPITRHVPCCLRQTRYVYKAKLASSFAPPPPACTSALSSSRLLFASRLISTRGLTRLIFGPALPSRDPISLQRRRHHHHNRCEMSRVTQKTTAERAKNTKRLSLTCVVACLVTHSMHRQKNSYFLLFFGIPTSRLVLREKTAPPPPLPSSWPPHPSPPRTP